MPRQLLCLVVLCSAFFLVCPLPGAEPKSAAEAVALGESHCKAGEYEAAIRAYTAALKFDPKCYHALVGRARARAWHGNRGGERWRENAIADCTAALRLDPKSPKAHDDRAEIFICVEEYGKAIADCDEALRLDSRDSVAYATRARADRGRGDLDQAIADFTEAIRLDPKNEDLYARRANVYHNKGDYDAAAAGYRPLLALLPNRAAEIKSLMIFEYTWGGERLAGNIVGVTAQRTPLNPEPEPGSRPQSTRRPSARPSFDALAIDAFTKAIRLGPHCRDAWEPYTGRASVYAQQGELDLALADYTRAIDVLRKPPPQSEQDKTTAAHYRALTLCWGFEYLLKGELTLAMSYLLPLDHELAYPAHCGRADVYARLGQFDKAILDYNRLVLDQCHGCFADRWLFNYYRGEAFAHLGKLDLAVMDFGTAIDASQPDPSDDHDAKRMQVYLARADAYRAGATRRKPLPT